MWCVKCGAGSVECDVWRVKFGVWSFVVRSNTGKCLVQAL